MNQPPSVRILHPGIENIEIWPGPEGYPWSGTGVRLWTREGLLRRLGPDQLICMWTTGGHIEPWLGNFTMIRTSADNGRTWQDAGEFRHPQRGLFTTELFVSGSGEIHAFLNTYEPGVWMTQLLSYRAISRDGGQTWDGPNSIPGGIANVWPNRGISHGSGRWIIPVSWAEHKGPEWACPTVGRSPDRGSVGKKTFEAVEIPYGAGTDLHYRTGAEWADRNHRYVCGAMLSDDEGATFRLRGYLLGGVSGHLMEPRVVELSDGSVAMLIRSQRDGRLWRSDSPDGGETWSVPERTDIPNPAAKVNILKSRDGRIFMLHNPVDITGLTYGGRNPLSLWISEDDMKTWSVKVDLVKDPDPSVNLNYPDGFIDEAAGQLVVCWEDALRVYLMRVPMDIR